MSGHVLWLNFTGDAARVKYLIENKNADVNKRDEDGATALMFASMRGHVVCIFASYVVIILQEVVQILLHHHADINATDGISGWTALMQSLYYGVSFLTTVLSSMQTIELSPECSLTLVPILPFRFR